MAIKNQSFYDRVAPVLLVIVVGLAFAVGVLWQKVSDLSGGTRPVNTGTGAEVDDSQAPPPQNAYEKVDKDQALKLPLVSSLSEDIKPQEGQKLREKDHIRGSKNAEILLIEYSDFECPFCASFHPTAEQAMQEYGDKIAWVYRHFPLDSIHPKARPAANAAECIAELGGDTAFWKFADEVFKNPASLSDLSGTAVKVGVNKAAFDSCLKANKHNAVVDADYQEGLQAGVTGTPGNFIVNKKGEVWVLKGAVPYATLKQAIEEALAS